MKLRRVAGVVLRQFYLYSGSATRVVPLFVWVAIDMVLWGFMTRYLSTVATPGINFVASILGAVLLWDFLTRVMQGVTTAFFEDVWSRNFLNMFSTPISMPEYLGGLVLSSILTSAIGLVVMLVLAGLVFGLSFLALGPVLLPFLMILFMTGIALGISACAMVLKLGPSAEWFIWPIPAFLAPVVGVFYPLATLPPWLRALAKALPPSYVFENLRALAAGRPADLSELWWGTALALGYILVAGFFFTKVYLQAVRIGTIARYSAENY